MRTIRQRYELQAEIGHGASSSVWSAHDARLRRKVAVKLMRAEGRQQWLEYFESEAWTTAQLRSANIVQVFDVGIEDDVPFLVMELLEGESLERRLHRQGHFSLRLAAAVVGDIASGLGVIHAAGVVHRDVKPANVFMARDGQRETLKLLDFGIAVSTDRMRDLQSVLDTPAGTPWYMSPEQFAGELSRVDDDLWSLAVLAYQLITGALPFQASSLLELRQRVGAGACHPPSYHLERLPAAVDALFARAFQLDRAKRFGSAHEFARELAHLAEHDAETCTRVLVLDDEPDMEDLVLRRFRREIQERRYELVFARDGADGLDRLRQRPDLDVVLTDLNMPGMDGLSFLAHVPEVNPFVRVIVVTAYSDLSNIRTAMNRGAFDFLCKPINFVDLKSTVAKSAEHVRTLRRAYESGRENLIMKLLLDPSSADKLLHSADDAHGPETERVSGSVVSLEVRDLPTSPAELGLARMNAFYELALPELIALGGRIVHLVDHSLLALFTGEGHVRRAADACIALQEELASRARSTSLLEHGGFSVGIDVGELLIGPLGSIALGRIGQAVVGECALRACQLARQGASASIQVSRSVRDELGADYEVEPTWQRDASSEVFALVRRVTGSPQRDSQATTQHAVPELGVVDTTGYVGSG